MGETKMTLAEAQNLLAKVAERRKRAAAKRKARLAEAKRIVAAKGK